MPMFFFPVDYDGFRHADEQGEDLPTAEAAVDHARLVAGELSRNNGKSVTVFVVADDGARVIAATGVDDTGGEERIKRRA